jgi:cytochrome P450
MGEGEGNDSGWLQAYRQMEDPYPGYHRLRTEAPFFREERTGALLLTRYADVAAALKHPQMSSRGVIDTLVRVPLPLRRLARPVMRALSLQMIFSDPPDHARLRSLANRAFTPRTIEKLRAHIQQITDELLDALDAKGGPAPVDLIDKLAAPLPIRVIAEMLGVPIERRDQIKLWSDDLAIFVGGGPGPRWKEVLRGARGGFCLRQYLRRLIRERRGEPRDDLLGALIAAEEKGDTLTEEELWANAILLLFAGHETTTGLIGNGLLALLRHPDQLDLLRREPTLMESAIEELLRFDGPIHRIGRMAKADLSIGGSSISAGQTVILGLAAANRDPAQFPDPDRLDVRRAENRHLAFGHGIHFCLGAALARLEGQIAIGTLLRRYPDLRLTGERLAWRRNSTLRGLQALPVRLR